jgi:hypothetical protein
MQISRRILLACAAATALFPLMALSRDNAAQVKAREALEQQMNQAPPAEPAIVPPPPMPAAPPPTPPPAPPAPVKHRRAPKAPAVKPAPAVEWPELPSTAATENSHEIEDALHQKMLETHAQPPPAPAMTAQPAPAPAEHPAEVAPAPAPPTVAPAAEPIQPASPPVTSTRTHRVSKTAAAQTTNDNAKWGAVEITPGMGQEQMNQAQQALQEKMSQMGPEPKQENLKEATSNEVKPESRAVRAPAQASTTAAKRAPVTKTKLPPLPAPPSPVSASKEQQLQNLLQQYTSDQISPEQYHQQRAKILSEP